MTQAAIDPNVIPPMTHELSRGWHQPEMSEVLIDGRHAIVPEAVFEKLSEYSATNPSGVYEGKCWKRKEAAGFGKKWFLCWYGFSDRPSSCSVNVREAILV